MSNTVLLILLLPAFGALMNGLRAFARPLQPKSKGWTNFFALGSTGVSALLALRVALSYRQPWEHAFFSWIPTGLGQVTGGFLADFNVNFALRIDSLSITMMLIVTWVGFLIHIYATGYMAHESGYTRFFCYLNLFMFMMLLLVLGANYIVMFVGWEGVGLCSYLLIGFYYDKNFAADAGKKAFVVNRIGDFGFILGIFLIFNTFGTSDYSRIFPLVSAHPSQYAGIAGIICLLLFVGACGKSAQIPLYVWLPDAMAGPTPVSALIHAATMVTAGVYMLVRSNVLYRISPGAMGVVAVIGAATAIFAASIALAQNDIKKVLAYSTVSQLGYMFLAVGVGAFTASIFHLMTHAFFKACLFLGAGSVIHGCGGEQDMRKMGGLWKYMPKTAWTMLISCLAIAGMPPLAGFFSKDEILASAWEHHAIVWFVGVVAASFTAFYMFRLFFMTFTGGYRGAVVEGIEASEPKHAGHDLIPGQPHLDQGDEHDPLAHGHHSDVHVPHESPWSMTGVLIALALLATLGGLVGTPVVLFGSNPTYFQKWIGPVMVPIGGEPFEFGLASRLTELALMFVSVAVGVIGIALAWRFYHRDPMWALPKRIASRLSPVHRLLENKYYIDELYNRTVVRGTLALGRLLWWIDANIVDGLVNLTWRVTLFLFGHGSSLFDRFIVDGAVNGVAFATGAGSRMFRRMQSGFVQNYALVMGGGIVLIAVIYLFLKP